MPNRESKVYHSHIVTVNILDVVSNLIPPRRLVCEQLDGIVSTKSLDISNFMYLAFLLPPDEIVESLKLNNISTRLASKV